MRKVLFFIFIFSLLYLPSTPSQVKTDRLDKYLFKYYQIKGVPSISVGISKNDTNIYVKSIGEIDIENHVKANSSSVYRIASVSKLFTAIAIMQLVERNKIKLDSPAKKYIPSFPKKKWSFTVRQLLQHTAGIRTYKSDEEFNSTKHFDSIDSALNVIVNDPLIFKPGTKYLYTTLGYNILAAIIENVSGLTYYDYLKKFILEPLKMNSTVLDIHQQIIENRARGYVKNDFGFISNAPLADLSIKYPGGGILSSAADLLKFGNALLYNKLIKKSTLQQMLIPINEKDSITKHRGLGIELDTTENKAFVFGHRGYGTGFSSLLAIFPDDSVVAVHLINLRDRNLGMPALELVNLLNGFSVKPLKIAVADTLLKTFGNSGIPETIKLFMSVYTDSSRFSINKSELSYFVNQLEKNNYLSEAATFIDSISNFYNLSRELLLKEIQLNIFLKNYSKAKEKIKKYLNKYPKDAKANILLTKLSNNAKWKTH